MAILENKAIKRYIDLVLIGDSTIPERFGIIQATKIKAQQQLDDLQRQMDLLEYKENYYKNLIKNNLNDEWNPMNKVENESIASIKTPDYYNRAFCFRDIFLYHQQ